MLSRGGEEAKWREERVRSALAFAAGTRVKESKQGGREPVARGGWDWQTCGWQWGRKTTLSLSVRFSFFIIDFFKSNNMFSSSTEGDFLGCSLASKTWSWQPSLCQCLLSLLWRRRGWPRLSAEIRSASSLPRRLRAFPRLASSGQHKPALWAQPSQSSQAPLTAPSRLPVLVFCKEGVRRKLKSQCRPETLLQLWHFTLKLHHGLSVSQCQLQRGYLMCLHTPMTNSPQ